MHYCEECRQNMDWPKADSGPVGNCKLCGKHGKCYDMEPSCLPLPDERKLLVIDHVDLPKEWSDCMYFSAALQEEINDDLAKLAKKSEKNNKMNEYMRLLNKLYYD